MSVERAKSVPPFVLWCTAMIPTAFDDSMSYYEALCALYKFIQDNLVEPINNNATVLDQTVKDMATLKKYVDTYFDNLDVQEEINNKLDEMAEGGQLAGIIAQFLEMSPVFGFGTISDMAASENMSNGSIARVLGNTVAENGDGAYYLVKTKEEGETADGVLKVAIGDTLIAHRIVNPNDAEIAALDTRVDGVSERVDVLEEPKWAFIGDSYGAGWTPDGTTAAWPNLLKTKMGLDNDHCTIAVHSGAGFSNPSYPFDRIISEMQADDRITDVLIAGGANDTDGSFNDVREGVRKSMENIAEKFPNCKHVYVGFIGGRTDSYHGLIHLATERWNNACIEYGAEYMPNLQYVMFYGTRFSSDGIHPNLSGQTAITNALFQALNGGYTYTQFTDITFSANTDMFNEATRNLHKYSINQLSYLANYMGTLILNTGTHGAIEWNHGAAKKIGSLSRNQGILGTQYYSNTMYNIGHVIVHDNVLGWRTLNGLLYIDEDADVYLRLQDQTEGAGYLDMTGVDSIQLPIFSILFMTDLM